MNFQLQTCGGGNSGVLGATGPRNGAVPYSRVFTRDQFVLQEPNSRSRRLLATAVRPRGSASIHETVRPTHQGNTFLWLANSL